MISIAPASQIRRAEARAAPHRFPVRVYWEDTDAGGIVYYANYLKFMERGRSDLVRRCAIDYLMPARLEDEIVVQSSLTRLGGATIELRQDILRGEAMLTRAEVQLACIDRAGRPRRLPASVREALAGLLAERETAQERSD